jgi:hypothetical protein
MDWADFNGLPQTPASSRASSKGALSQAELVEALFQRRGHRLTRSFTEMLFTLSPLSFCFFYYSNFSPNCATLST